MKADSVLQVCYIICAFCGPQGHKDTFDTHQEEFEGGQQFTPVLLTPSDGVPLKDRHPGVRRVQLHHGNGLSPTQKLIGSLTEVNKVSNVLFYKRKKRMHSKKFNDSSWVFFNIIKIDNDKINPSDPVVHLCTIFTTSKLMKIHCSKI